MLPPNHDKLTRIWRGLLYLPSEICAVAPAKFSSQICHKTRPPGLYNIRNMLSMCPKKQNVGQVQHFSTSAVLFAHPSTGSCCNQSTKSIIPKHPPVSSVESRSGWRGCPNAPLMLPILHSIYELENDTWQEQQNLILRVFSCLSILFVQLPAPLGD